MKITGPAFAAMLSFASLLLAQLNRGTITGMVTDSTGAVIPQVKIAVRNTATGATYETVSNEAGQYTMPNLPVGNYQLAFDAPGFKRLVRSGIHLRVNEVLRVDISLEVGAVTESVEVRAELPRLQTSSAEVSTSLSSRSITDLPLSFAGARQVEAFAYKIVPGVWGDTWRSHILGSTAHSKELLLDGASVTTTQSGEFGQTGVSLEAVQEFKILTSGLSAEFGRTQSGVFNFVMKSGTNEIHGSLYGGLRNEALNANTFTNKFRGLKRARDRQHNYAGSFGGPVFLPKLYDGHNRSFFYVAYERFQTRQWAFGAPSVNAPLPEFYEGDFHRLLGPVTEFTDGLGRQVARGAIYDPATFRQLPNGRWVGEPFPGNRIPVSRFSQVSQRLNAIAKKHYLPTVRDASGQIPLTNNMYFPASDNPEVDKYQVSIKADHIFSDKHKLTGSYAYSYRPRLLLDQGGLWDPSDRLGGPLSRARVQPYTGTYARLAEDWTVTPRWLNHFMVFYNRRGNPNYVVHRNVDGAKQLGIKNLSTRGFPTINWGGGPFVTLAPVGYMQDEFRADEAWGVMNTVSFTRGRHFLKLGFDMRRHQQDTRSRPTASFTFQARGTAIPLEPYSGTQIGHSFASYLLGIVDSAGLSDPVGLGGRRRYHAVFIQDDFKVSKRLTLNLGLRWEYQPPFFEVADRLSSWNPNKTDPASGLPGAYDFAGKCPVCTGKRSFGTRSFDDFGPRFGFAWRLRERWTLRGAYGVMYEGDIFNGYSPTGLGKPTSVAWGGTWRLSPDPVNPWRGIFNWDEGLPLDRYEPPSFDVSWGNKSRPGMIDPQYGEHPYIQKWNINLQYEPARNLLIDVGYLASKGTRLGAGELRRINQLPASVLSAYGARLNAPVRNAAEAAAQGIRYPFPGFSGTVASALRPHPQVQGNQTVQVFEAPLGFTAHHSLQIIINRELTSGFNLFANYVWSKTMANVESSLVNDNPDRPLDYYNLKLEKAVSGHDRPHMVKVYASWELPVGRGKPWLAATGRWVNALLGGWSVSCILNYFSGTPLGFPGSFPLTGGWNGATNRANIAAGPMKRAGFDKSKFELSTISSPNNTYLNKASFSDPPPLTLGTAARLYTQVRTFGTISEDLGLHKAHRIREKYRFQMRAEFLNVFNRHQLGGIVTSVTNPNFGQVTSVSGNRTVQLAARLDF